MLYVSRSGVSEHQHKYRKMKGIISKTLNRIKDSKVLNLKMNYDYTFKLKINGVTYIRKISETMKNRRLPWSL